MGSLRTGKLGLKSPDIFGKNPSDQPLIRDRALGLPLERPKSVTMEWLENYCKKAA